LADGTAVGCEALVRWRHPQRGLTSPDEFVPVAEEHGLIARVGSEVLRMACNEARGWREKGHHAYVSVNVSPLQLLRGDMAGEVKAVLEETRLPAPLLCLEITETSFVDDAEVIAPALEEMRELGVRIAIDDFGGGTSSLSFLSILPIDILKIDQRFVQSLTRRRDDRAIVAAIISMAEELDLTVIAEGVEEELQHNELRDLGCTLAQGYLYARPGPGSDLSLHGYAPQGHAGVGDPSVIREFMRQIGIPARVGPS
jgi:EAL domain-containing protein (putative c-di-GMP-specific phosphodiesterase class I)